MIVHAGLLIDFGNSETRMELHVNNKSKLYFLSNKFAELPPLYEIPNEYKNPKSTVFYYNGSHFANGQIVEREFVGSIFRPTSIQMKTEQLVTELSLNLIFAQAMMILTEELNIPIPELDVTFNVSALLPPLEHDVAEDKMVAMIKSFTGVKTLCPYNVDVNFKIGEVNVYPEGVAAFFGAFFEETIENNNLVLTVVEENKQFEEGYVLVIDIGAGTTDVALICDTELVQNSKDTFKIGGNTVESFVRRDINGKFGYCPNDLSEVIKTGAMPEGVDFHYVEDIINVAKDRYSKTLVGRIIEYLERMMIEMREIKGVLVVGGGSLPAIRDGKEVSPAMADVLIKYFETLAPRIRKVDTKGKNTRHINITGLRYMHKYA